MAGTKTGNPLAGLGFDVTNEAPAAAKRGRDTGKVSNALATLATLIAEQADGETRSPFARQSGMTPDEGKALASAVRSAAQNLKIGSSVRPPVVADDGTVTIYFAAKPLRVKASKDETVTA